MEAQLLDALAVAKTLRRELRQSEAKSAALGRVTSLLHQRLAAYAELGDGLSQHRTLILRRPGRLGMVLQGAVLPSAKPHGPSRLASRVASVTAGLAADQAGLKEGDILLAADAHTLVDALPTDIFDLLQASGGHVILTVAAARSQGAAAESKDASQAASAPAEKPPSHDATLVALELVNGERQRLAEQLRVAQQQLSAAPAARRPLVSAAVMTEPMPAALPQQTAPASPLADEGTEAPGQPRSESHAAALETLRSDLQQTRENARAAEAAAGDRIAQLEAMLQEAQAELQAARAMDTSTDARSGQGSVDDRLAAQQRVHEAHLQSKEKEWSHAMEEQRLAHEARAAAQTSALEVAHARQTLDLRHSLEQSHGEAEAALRATVEALQDELSASQASHVQLQEELAELRRKAQAEQRTTALASEANGNAELQACRAESRQLAQQLQEARQRTDEAAQRASRADEACSRLRRELELAEATQHDADAGKKEIWRLQGEMEHATEERRRLSGEVERTKEERRRLGEQLERIREERQRLGDALAVTKADSQRLADELERAKAEGRRLEQDYGHSEAEGQRLADELERAKAEGRRLADGLGRSEAEARRLADELERAKAESRRLEQDHGHSEAEARRLADELMGAKGESRRLGLELERAKEEHRRLDSDLERHREESLQLLRAKDDANVLVASARDETQRLAAELERATRDHHSQAERATKEIQRLREEVRRAKDDAQRWQEEVTRAHDAESLRLRDQCEGLQRELHEARTQAGLESRRSSAAIASLNEQLATVHRDNMALTTDLDAARRRVETETLARHELGVTSMPSRSPDMSPEQQHQEAVDQLRQRHALELDIITEEHESAKTSLQQQHSDELHRLRQSHQLTMQAVQGKCSAELNGAQRDHVARLAALRQSASRQLAEAEAEAAARLERAQGEAQAALADTQRQADQRLRQAQAEAAQALDKERQRCDAALEQCRAQGHSKLRQLEEQSQRDLLECKTTADAQHADALLALEQRQEAEVAALKQQRMQLLAAAQEEVDRLREAHAADMAQLREGLRQELRSERERGEATVAQARQALDQRLALVRQQHEEKEKRLCAAHEAHMAEAERDAKAALERHQRQLSGARADLERDFQAQLDELREGHALALAREQAVLGAAPEPHGGGGAGAGTQSSATRGTERSDLPTRLCIMRLQTRLNMCLGLLRLQPGTGGPLADTSAPGEASESRFDEAGTAEPALELHGSVAALESRCELLLQSLRRHFAKEQEARRPQTEQLTALLNDMHAELTASLSALGSAGLGALDGCAQGGDDQGAVPGSGLSGANGNNPLLLLGAQTLQLVQRVPRALQHIQSQSERQLEGLHCENRSLQARIGMQTAALDELSQQVQAALSTATSEESRAAAAIAAARRANELMQQSQRASQRETQEARRRAEELQTALAAQERDMATALAHATQGSRAAQAEAARLQHSLADAERRLNKAEEDEKAAQEVAMDASGRVEQREAENQALRADLHAAQAAQAEEARRAAAAHAAERALDVALSRAKEELAETRGLLEESRRASDGAAAVLARLDEERLGLAAALGVRLDKAVMSPGDTSRKKAPDGRWQVAGAGSVAHLAAALAKAQRELRARDERVAQLRSCLNDARRNMQRLFEGNGSLLAQLEHVAGKKNRAERVLGRITPLEETSEGRRGLRQLEAAS